MNVVPLMIFEILASSVLSSTRQRVIDNDNDDDAIFKVLQELCDLSLYLCLKMIFMSLS